MRWIVLLRNAAGREQTVTIHEKPTANQASNKAVRVAASREPGRWYVVSCDPR